MNIFFHIKHSKLLPFDILQQAIRLIAFNDVSCLFVFEDHENNGAWKGMLVVTILLVIKVIRHEKSNTILRFNTYEITF